MGDVCTKCYFAIRDSNKDFFTVQTPSCLLNGPLASAGLRAAASMGPMWLFILYFGGAAAGTVTVPGSAREWLWQRSGDRCVGGAGIALGSVGHEARTLTLASRLQLPSERSRFFWSRAVLGFRLKDFALLSGDEGTRRIQKPEPEREHSGRAFPSHAADPGRAQVRFPAFQGPQILPGAISESSATWCDPEKNSQIILGL